MINQPFHSFVPFAPSLSVRLFTKEDMLMSSQLRRIADCMEANDVVGLRQEHGNRVVVARHGIAQTERADGVITTVSRLALTVRFADCQNFVIYEPDARVVGVLHVGWRGIVAEIIPVFFRILLQDFGVRAQDVWVGAGASLCQSCAEFSQPREELPNVPSLFMEKRCVNLQGMATAQLLHEGVLPTRIERSADCTRCSPDRYWTYRGGHREEVRSGMTNVLAAMLL